MDLIWTVKSDIKWQKQELNMHLYDFKWPTASWKQSLGELLQTWLIRKKCDPGRPHLENQNAKIFLKQPFTKRTREPLRVKQKPAEGSDKALWDSGTCKDTY